MRPLIEKMSGDFSYEESHLHYEESHSHYYDIVG